MIFGYSVLFRNSYFRGYSGSHRIGGFSYKILNQIAGVLIANPTYIVEVRGHTDNSGKREKNVKLSEDRAKSVRQWLVDHGIAATRMTTKGFGPDSPVAPNDTPENKQKNRRIEFALVLEPAAR